MAYYNFKMVRDRLPEWRVKEWEEDGGSADCDSELWRHAAEYIDELKLQIENLVKLSAKNASCPECATPDACADGGCISSSNKSMNIKQPNPRIICADGVSLSVQASSFHYCHPRIDELDHWTDYSSVEVGFIKNANDEDFTPPDDWKAYAEDGFPSDVYSFVPTQMVKEFIEKHGGTVI